jgi:methionyl-tRNA formyltransferase
MKYIFWGGKDIGNYILTQLLELEYKPSGIIVYQKNLDEGLLESATNMGIPIYQIHKFKLEESKLIAFTKQIEPDAFVSVAFPYIIPKTIIDLVRYPINIHTGAIPKYRGHHPISAALLNNEPYQGTTIHFMEEEVDAGDIIHQDFVKVENEDSINTIKYKLILKSNQLIQITLKQLYSNTIFSRKQIGHIIWAPKRTANDSFINFNNTSRYLHNFIRALEEPYPNAFGYIGSDKILIKKSLAHNTPGVVIDKTINNRYVVSTNDGVILIETNQNLNIGDTFNLK